MYTKWWTAATFLLTRIYLCVNNGHNKNFNPVFYHFQVHLDYFYQYYSLQMHSFAKYTFTQCLNGRVVALQRFKTKYQNP